MKKYVVMALTMALLLSVSSCGNKKTDAEQARKDSIRVADSLARVKVDDKKDIGVGQGDSIQANAEADVHDCAVIEAFVRDIYTEGGLSQIFEESWIKEHCTKELQQQLRDDYEFEGDGYAMWEIGGWGDGEDVSTELANVTYDGREYCFVTLVPKGNSKEYVVGKRVIRLGVSVVNDVVVLSSVEWTEDWKYTNLSND